MIDATPDAAGLVRRTTNIAAGRVRGLDEAVTEHDGLGHGVTLEGMNILGRLFEDTAQEIEAEGRKLAEWAEGRAAEVEEDEGPPPAVGDLLGAASWALNTWDSTEVDDGHEDAVENLREVVAREKRARERAPPAGGGPS